MTSDHNRFNLATAEHQRGKERGRQDRRKKTHWHIHTRCMRVHHGTQMKAKRGHKSAITDNRNQVTVKACMSNRHRQHDVKGGNKGRFRRQDSKGFKWQRNEVRIEWSWSTCNIIASITAVFKYIEFMCIYCLLRYIVSEVKLKVCCWVEVGTAATGVADGFICNTRFIQALQIGSVTA